MSLLDRILEPGQLRTLYQPIISFAENSPKIFAFECLTRGPRGTNLEPADVLFEYARRKGGEDALDIACMHTALAQAESFAATAKLFVNVHASTLGKGQAFIDELEGACVQSTNISLSNIVLEIIEHSPFWDYSEFIRSTSRLRKLGVQIAVDDLGVAYSSFKMMLDVQPQFLKADMYITRGCHRDRTRAAMLESFQHLAQKCGALLIAEGVEHKSEMDTLLSMEIPLLQGYLFARPNPATDIDGLLRSFAEVWTQDSPPAPAVTL